MSGQPRFVSPFHRPQCLAAAAPAGNAKFTHPGKAILAGKKSLYRTVQEQVFLQALLHTTHTYTHTYTNTHTQRLFNLFTSFITESQSAERSKASAAITRILKCPLYNSISDVV